MKNERLAFGDDDFLVVDQVAELFRWPPTVILALMETGILKYYLVYGVRWMQVKDVKAGYVQYQELWDEFTQYLTEYHLLAKRRIRYVMDVSPELLFFEWVSRRKELPEIYIPYFG